MMRHGMFINCTSGTVYVCMCIDCTLKRYKIIQKYCKTQKHTMQSGEQMVNKQNMLRCKGQVSYQLNPYFVKTKSLKREYKIMNI